MLEHEYNIFSCFSLKPVQQTTTSSSHSSINQVIPSAANPQTMCCQDLLSWLFCCFSDDNTGFGGDDSGAGYDGGGDTGAQYPQQQYDGGMSQQQYTGGVPQQQQQQYGAGTPGMYNLAPSTLNATM